MKKILLTEEKHGTYAYDISTPEMADKVYLHLFKEREDKGWYSDIKYGFVLDGKMARRFLLRRSSDDYEYEKIMEIEIEEI